MVSHLFKTYGQRRLRRWWWDFHGVGQRSSVQRRWPGHKSGYLCVVHLYQWWSAKLVQLLLSQNWFGGDPNKQQDRLINDIRRWIITETFDTNHVVHFPMEYTICVSIRFNLEISRTYSNGNPLLHDHIYLIKVRAVSNCRMCLVCNEYYTNGVGRSELLEGWLVNYGLPLPGSGQLILPKTCHSHELQNQREIVIGGGGVVFRDFLLYVNPSKSVQRKRFWAASVKTIDFVHKHLENPLWAKTLLFELERLTKQTFPAVFFIKTCSLSLMKWTSTK